MMKREGLVLVNGPPNAVLGPRARALFDGVLPVVYKERGRFGSIRPLWSALRKVEVGVIYCIDMGFPACLLAAWKKQLSPDVRLIFEIGDPALPLLANQRRPAAEVALADWIDRDVPLAADHLVFRGSYLVDYYAKLWSPRPMPRWTWLPDGVDTEVFRPSRGSAEVAALRKAHGLEGRFVVGLLGSIHRNVDGTIFYGWELAEALAKIPAEAPVVGVIVGDGPGMADLEAARERLGLGDRLRLVGRVPHAEVPSWLNVFDVALSTQTDDAVGWGRTTAKLPEYLACGTAVICSDVGEAHRWLKESGQTLPYHGFYDAEYPARVAGRLRAMARADLNPLRTHNRELACRLFDYTVLRKAIEKIL